MEMSSEPGIASGCDITLHIPQTPTLQLTVVFNRKAQVEAEPVDQREKIWSRCQSIVKSL